MSRRGLGNKVAKKMGLEGSSNRSRRGRGGVKFGKAKQNAYRLISPNKKPFGVRRAAARRHARYGKARAIAMGKIVKSTKNFTPRKFKRGQIAHCNYGAERKFVGPCDVVPTGRRRYAESKSRMASFAACCPMAARWEPVARDRQVLYDLACYARNMLANQIELQLRFPQSFRGNFLFALSFPRGAQAISMMLLASTVSIFALLPVLGSQIA